MMTDKDLDINVFDFQNEQDIKEKKKILHYEKYRGWYIYGSLLLMSIIYLLPFFISNFLKSLGIGKEITILFVFSLMSLILYKMCQDYLRKTKYQLKKINEKIEQHIIEQQKKIDEEKRKGNIVVQLKQKTINYVGFSIIEKFQKWNINYRIKTIGNENVLSFESQNLFIDKKSINDFVEFSQKNNVEFSVYY